MTLYNKDGSVYKLIAPNPAMKEQNIWSAFSVHNMTWKPEFKEDGTMVMPMGSDFELSEKNQGAIFLDELDSSKISENEFKKENIKVNKKEQELKPSIEKTFIYCLPAIIREKKDDLYGDVYKTIQYEKPTSFEAVILTQNDLFMELWTDSSFGEGSILYPKNGDKRWWKVQDKEQKVGGWILKSVPSQNQPSFDF